MSALTDNFQREIHRTILLDDREYDVKASIQITTYERQESRGQHFGNPCSETMRYSDKEIEELLVFDSGGHEVNDETILQQLSRKILNDL